MIRTTVLRPGERLVVHVDPTVTAAGFDAIRSALDRHGHTDAVIVPDAPTPLGELLRVPRRHAGRRPRPRLVAGP